MLSQKYPHKKIHIYDRLNAPPSPTDQNVWNDVAKFYLIGLGSRGQNALAKYGVWDECEKVCTTVVGRKDWSPEANGEEDGVERIFTDRPVKTQVLPRDKLVGVLHQHIMENYSDQIQLNYGYDTFPIDFGMGENGNDVVTLRISKCDFGDDDGSDNNRRQMPSSALNEDESDLCDVKVMLKTHL